MRWGLHGTGTGKPNKTRGQCRQVVKSGRVSSTGTCWSYRNWQAVTWRAYLLLLLRPAGFACGCSCLLAVHACGACVRCMHAGPTPVHAVRGACKLHRCMLFAVLASRAFQTATPDLRPDSRAHETRWSNRPSRAWYHGAAVRSRATPSATPLGPSRQQAPWPRRPGMRGTHGASTHRKHAPTRGAGDARRKHAPQACT